MSRAHRSHVGAAGLLGRAFTAGPGASVALAVLVAVSAFLAVLVPRAVEALHTSALVDRLSSATAYELDLTAEYRERPQLGPSEGGTTLDPTVDAVWGGQEERLVGVRDALPHPLRDAVGDPQVALVSGPAIALPTGAAPGGPVSRIQPGVDPRMREHLRLLEGDWPAPIPGPAPSLEEQLIDVTRPGTVTRPPGIDEPVEFVMAAPIAERMAWSVGEQRSADLGGLGTLPVVLVGTVEAVDTGDGYWSHLPTALRPSVIDRGLAPPEITGMGFVDPAAWAHLQTQPLPSSTSVWLPVVPDAIASSDLARLEAELGELGSSVVALGDGQWFGTYGTVGTVGFTSSLPDLIREQLAQQGAVDAVLATVASGPVGVMAAVLVLAAGVVFERRRAGLELAAARGASDGQLRGALAAEGLAAGLPAAVLGGTAALLLSPGQTTTGGWIVAAAFALTPAVLLVASAPALSPMRRSRADLGRAPSRWRWVWEALALIVAVVAVGLLAARSSAARDGAAAPAAAGIDPLLAAVPLLVALAGCVLVLRAYPIPLAAIVRRQKARAGLVPFLGSARALRDPSAGLVPVLAVVVGVAVAVFSSVVLGTVRAGAEHAASARVGADASLTSLWLTLDQQDAIAAVPGVAATALVYSTTPTDLEVDGRHSPTTLIVVDTEQVRDVQADHETALDLPEALADEADDDAPVPLLVSGAVDRELADAESVEMDGHDVDIVGVIEGRTPFAERTAWLMIDRVNAEPFTDTLVPRQVLIRFEPGADRAAASAEIERIAGDGAVVLTPEQLSGALAARPDTQGLITALVGAIVVTSLLTALALVLALIVGRPARARLLPLLATLGLGRRGERGLVAWELGPMTAVAVVVGAVLGVVMPLAVLPGIDLTGFTGGDAQPAITIDVPLVVAVLAGSVVVAALATAIAAVLGGRVSAARALRKEEE
ncbi:hypothetical protein ABIQ69_04690 [Agromyces sp. G08B096]|uniref:ABC transport system permease protein n=1 Tax=Agromyces sp. G08B096 TaxID=3156399 RepID=A0AAU7W9T8_9MICO